MTWTPPIIPSPCLPVGGEMRARLNEAFTAQGTAVALWLDGRRWYGWGKRGGWRDLTNAELTHWITRYRLASAPGRR